MEIRGWQFVPEESRMIRNAFANEGTERCVFWSSSNRVYFLHVVCLACKCIFEPRSSTTRRQREKLALLVKNDGARSPPRGNEIHLWGLGFVITSLIAVLELCSIQAEKNIHREWFSSDNSLSRRWLVLISCMHSRSIIWESPVALGTAYCFLWKTKVNKKEEMESNKCIRDL